MISTEHTWIQTDAVDQLQQIAALPGAVQAAGMPDLHPGAGAPIGASLLADRIYPHLVGSDIGCGVALWHLELGRRPSPEKLARRLDGLDAVAPGELPADWADRFGAPHHDTLGTIGGGNHFLEIVQVDEVFDSQVANRHGLTTGTVLLMVHSGSRGLGKEVLADHQQFHGSGPCPPLEQSQYLARHDAAVRFGHANRAAIALRAADRLRADLDPLGPLTDICHNSVTPAPGGWLHRKGAAPNETGAGAPELLTLPGSRGARSHVVTPSADDAARERALWSVAHGAGRKHSRTAARARFRDVPRKELTTTRYGSRVICEDPALLAEEAPGAYKDIEDVIEALVQHRLVRPVVALTPVVTYKTQQAQERRAREEQRRQRSRDRRQGR